MSDTLAPVLAATAWSTNGHLIADCFQLGYLRDEDSILDPTYGEGVWWNVHRPPNLTTLHRRTDGSDFRKLDYPDASFDAIAYDPPYVCVDTATEILTTHGWLSWDEVKVGDLAYTLDHISGVATWQPVEEVTILPSMSRPMLSMETSQHSSLTTLEHRWPVLRRRRSGTARAYQREWATSGTFLSDDRVPLAAPSIDKPTEAKYSDSLVEVVAWFWTEGTLDRHRDGRHSDYGNIVQSHVVNEPNCLRIRAALTAGFGPDSERFPRRGRTTDGIPRWRESLDGHKRVFWFSTDLGKILTTLAPGRVPTREFLLGLTTAQLDLFISVSMLADGHRRYDPGTNRRSATLSQKNRSASEAFQFACTLAGISTSLRLSNRHTHPMWRVRLRSQATMRAWQAHPSVVEHAGTVWCVRTANQTWLARRNGTVYFTGNCPGGRKTSTIGAMHDRYGMNEGGSADPAFRTPAELQSLINDGLTEMARLVRPARNKTTGGVILVKCQNYIWSGKLWEGAEHTREHALSLGLVVVDRMEMLGAPGPQPTLNPDGSPRRQVHARRNLSTLFVVRRPKLVVRAPELFVGAGS